jgi:hypothetical protein
MIVVAIKFHLDIFLTSSGSFTFLSMLHASFTSFSFVVSAATIPALTSVGSFPSISLIISPSPSALRKPSLCQEGSVSVLHVMILAEPPFFLSFFLFS